MLQFEVGSWEMWKYPATIGVFILLVSVVIVCLNLLIDYKKNQVILQREIYKRYQKKFLPIKKDMTLKQLRLYDGEHESTDYRIVIAIDGVLFDVTSRWDLYGPDRPYCSLAGRDASRSFVKFELDNTSDEYDNLLDLNSRQLDNLEEWKRQFKESFPVVGRLLKPGDENCAYNYNIDV